MIWKGLSVATNCESPIVVVLSGSMEPAFQRGDILFLDNRQQRVNIGDIVVYRIKEHDIPIVHRVIQERHGYDSQKVLTKGDNNRFDDLELYSKNQIYLDRENIIGVVKGFVPYVGWITLAMNDFPKLKYCFLGGMPLKSLIAMIYDKYVFRKCLGRFFFCFHPRFISGRAFIFENYGNPLDVLRLHTYDICTSPSKPILVKFLASPINPSDINQIEGVYPEKLQFNTDLMTNVPCAVPGNEGVVEIVQSLYQNLKPGKRAIMKKKAFGTWRTFATASPEDLLFLDLEGITLIQAATLLVNPCTAYCLLKNFISLQPGDYFIQNGSNSHVGQMIIQLSRIWGLKSINIIRNRPDVDKLKSYLYELGATHVITDTELTNKEFMKEMINKWTRNSGVSLGLNCIGGKSVLDLLHYIKENGHLITYGAMSRQPLSISSGSLIFKNIHLHGFWLTKYIKTYPEKELEILNNIIEYIKNGFLKELLCDKVYLDETLSDSKYMEMFKKALENKQRKQVLIFN
ncbi:hypothetical protein PMAC_002287 [Pneumocystis sp. 'macacae']|nr:hypothetical protein PMAC_002287 [Pneumocystis sp. 'macacae']